MISTGWWFQIFFIFIPIWGNDQIWLIFFKQCGFRKKTLQKIGLFWGQWKVWVGQASEPSISWGAKMILDRPPHGKGSIETTAKLLNIQDILDIIFFPRLEKINLWFLPCIFTLYWIQALVPKHYKPHFGRPNGWRTSQTPTESAAKNFHQLDPVLMTFAVKLQQQKDGIFEMRIRSTWKRADIDTCWFDSEDIFLYL